MPALPSDTGKREARKRLVSQSTRVCMALYGFSTADLNRAFKKKRPSTVLYQDPHSGKTWSGKGLGPHWIAGQDRETFRVKT